jgi:hypothetical protein
MTGNQSKPISPGEDHWLSLPAQLAEQPLLDLMAGGSSPHTYGHFYENYTEHDKI